MKNQVKDARWKRSRAQLETAVLKLAAERDISQSSVLELTRRAGINRTTFYAHANSPVELLIQILSRELKLIIDEANQAINKIGYHSVELSDTVLEAIFDHVKLREKIYSRANYVSSRYALRAVLTPLMEEGILLAMNQGLVVPPTKRPGDKAAYSATLTGVVVGAIENWILTKKRCPQKHVYDVINRSFPDWFIKPKKKKK